MFSPYHQFNECQSLQRLVQSYKDSGNCNEDVWKQYRRYHFSLIHKLTWSMYNVQELETTITALTREAIADDCADILSRINAKLDGFFYNAGSGDLPPPPWKWRSTSP